MSISFVQSAGDGPNFGTISVTMSVTSGNFLIVSIIGAGASPAPTYTVSDGSNTYTSAIYVQDATNFASLQVFTAPNTVSGSITITVTPTSGSTAGMFASEWSKTQAVVYLDATNSSINTSGSNSLSFTSCVINHGPELLIAMAGSSYVPGGYVGNGGSWVEFGQSNTEFNAGVPTFEAEYLTGVSSPQSLSWTNTNVNSWSIGASLSFYDGSALSIGTVFGSSNANGIGESALLGIGSALATSSTNAPTFTAKTSVGTINASSSTNGIGLVLYISAGTINANSSTNGISENVSLSIGTVNATSLTNGIGGSLIPRNGIINASSSTNGVGLVLYISIGTINGSSSTNGIVASNSIASGNSSTNGIGASINQATGTVNGSSNVFGDGVCLHMSIGTANGSSSLFAINANNISSGSSFGNSFAFGINAGNVSLGTANGSSSAFAGVAVVSIGTACGSSNAVNHGILDCSISFTWDDGQGPLLWYRVVGCHNTFLQYVVASNLTSLFQQLNTVNLPDPICEIGVFSQPADNRYVTPNEPDVLIPIPISVVNGLAPYLTLQSNVITGMGMTCSASIVYGIYTGGGSAVIGGSATTSTSGTTGSPNQYIGSGSIIVGGSATTVLNVNVGYETNMGMHTSVQNLNIVFSNKNNNPNVLTNSTNTITVDCLNCLPLPLVLQMTHNLNLSAIFIDFCNTNGIIVPVTIPMYYKVGSWQATMHYTGYSSVNQSNQEYWRFACDWSCVNTLNGVQLGTSVWQFGITVLRKNITTGVIANTKINLVIPPDNVCVNTVAQSFDFNFKINTQLGTFITKTNIVPYVLLINDNIGLFKSSAWVNNPNISIDIAQNPALPQYTRQSIFNIFPQNGG